MTEPSPNRACVHLLPARLPNRPISDNGTISNNDVIRRPRLLIVQPLVGIGDMVWHKPWIDHLAAEYDIILATKPTVQAHHLFAAEIKSSGQNLEILLIERSMRGRRGRHDGLIGLLRLVADFKAAKADAALLLHHSARLGFAIWMSGITERWGYGIGSSRHWLNRGNFLGRDARKVHPTNKMADFAAINGFAPDPAIWKITPTPDAHQRAMASLLAAGMRKDDAFIVMGVGAMDDERQWPTAHFAALIGLVRTRYPDLHILLMGAPSEMPLMDAVASGLADDTRIIISTSPIDEAVALLTNALLYVGNDTSLLNIAAACNRPAIGLFAQSDPLVYSPNIKAVSVENDQIGVAGAITKIPPKRVFDAVCKELSENTSPD